MDYYVIALHLVGSLIAFYMQQSVKQSLSGVQ